MRSFLDLVKKNDISKMKIHLNNIVRTMSSVSIYNVNKVSKTLTV